MVEGTKGNRARTMPIIAEIRPVAALKLWRTSSHNLGSAHHSPETVPQTACEHILTCTNDASAACFGAYSAQSLRSRRAAPHRTEGSGQADVAARSRNAQYDWLPPLFLLKSNRQPLLVANSPALLYETFCLVDFLCFLKQRRISLIVQNSEGVVQIFSTLNAMT